MPTLRDSTLDEVLTSLESWRRYTADGPSDLFIAAGGFEDRSVACFARWCEARRGRNAELLLIRYPFNTSDNAAQETRFRTIAAETEIQVNCLDYHRLALYGEAMTFLKEHATARNIQIDLSSMASFVFYPLMSAITDAASEASLEVCYTEAAEYFPTNGEWLEFKDKFKDLDLVERARLFDEYHFQSRGVQNVFESPHFPGRNENQPTSLIVVPNFSVERVQRMLNFAADNYSVNREECEWIIGMPPNHPQNGWRYEALWSLFNQPMRKHDACTLDFKDMLHTCHQIWQQTNEARSLVIATVGSKAQHLGTFMFLKMHPDVGLVLSEPKQFIASKYSTGTAAQWQTSFGNVRAWMTRLLEWNKIIFEW